MRILGGVPGPPRNSHLRDYILNEWCVFPYQLAPARLRCRREFRERESLSRQFTALRNDLHESDGPTETGYVKGTI